MSFKDYISQVFGVESNSDEIRVKCPFCSEEKKDNTLSCNVKKLVVHCFRCEYSESALSFLQDYEGYEIEEALEILNTRMHIIDLEPVKKVIGLKLPSYFEYLEKQLPNPNNIVAESCLRFLKYRGVPIDVIKKYHIGYGFDKFIKLIFPIYDDTHKQQSYIECQLSQNYKGKYLYPKNITTKDYTTMKKQQLLFGGQFLHDMVSGVYITEGVFDCLSLPFISVALLGKSLSEYNRMKLINLNKPVIVFLDGDNSGWSGAMKLCQKLYGDIDNLSIVYTPEDHDPNSWFLSCVDNAAFLKQVINRTVFYRAKMQYEHPYDI